MIKELYIYSCPKLSAEQKNTFNILHILCVSLLSSFIAIFFDITLGIVITGLYLGSSLLVCFIDKNYKTRYLKLVSLCVLDVTVAAIYMFSKLYPETPLAFGTIIGGILLSVIYEIVVFIKIKRKYYSSRSYNNKIIYAVSASSLFLVTVIFKIISKIPAFNNLVAVFLMLLCSAMLLVTLISIQKLIVYLLTKNKIQEDCDSTKEEIDESKN